MIEISDLQIMVVLVCDDVRREDNGKEILIGVYSGGAILLRSFPAMITPVFWCNFRTKRAGDFSVSFRVINENGVQFFQANAGIQMPQAGQLGSIPINVPPMQIHGETKLILQVRVGESEWTAIQETPVLSDRRQHQPH